MKFLIVVFPIFILLWFGCANDMSSINQMFNKEDINYEEARDVTLLYSDSAVVRVRITSPLLIRHLNKRNPMDEFPNGARVEFYNDDKKIKSWLEANYVVRHESDGKVLVRDRVVLYNTRKEKLETPELIWDELQGILHTDKFVRITRPETGDTITGFGIITDQDFTRFEIKRKIAAKLNYEDLSNALSNDSPNNVDSFNLR